MCLCLCVHGALCIVRAALLHNDVSTCRNVAPSLPVCDAIATKVFVQGQTKMLKYSNHKLSSWKIGKIHKLHEHTHSTTKTTKMSDVKNGKWYLAKGTEVSSFVCNLSISNYVLITNGTGCWFCVHRPKIAGQRKILQTAERMAIREFSISLHASVRYVWMWQYTIICSMENPYQNEHDWERDRESDFCFIKTST